MCVCQEAHEQGINVVKFSATSDLLATGGTDRVVKLWDVRAGSSAFLHSHDAVTRHCVLITWLMTSSPGSLTHRATLTGSTEGITCVDFSTTVSPSLGWAGQSWAELDSGLVTVTCVCCVQACWVIGASYDRSAQLWQRDESVPKVTAQHVSTAGSVESGACLVWLRLHSHQMC